MSTDQHQIIDAGFSVVAMSVKELPVFVFISTTLGTRLNVVDFEHILTSKEQSTEWASTVLPFEEFCLGFRQVGGCAEARCPVGPVPIKGTFGSSNFGVVLDGNVSVSDKGKAMRGDEVPFSGLSRPVFLHYPAGRFVGMAPFGPGQELTQDDQLSQAKRLFGIHA